MLTQAFKAYAEFQSTPVIADGRINFVSYGLISTLRFQSTPVIADGRIFVERRGLVPPEVFQSTPVIADGRIRQHDAGG